MLDASTAGTLVLAHRDVAELLDLEASAAAAYQAFLHYGRGTAQRPAMAGVPAKDGGFHIKAGILGLERPYFAAKINANFPHNPRRFGLPTIQGFIGLSDAENGYPLALMDSIEITLRRTAASTALAAEHLAREDACSLAIIGCGTQGRAHIPALRRVRRFNRIVLCDVARAAADTLAAELRREPELQVTVESDPILAARVADVLVTCTPSREFLLDRAALRPGMFVAGVGVDNEEKRELAPELLAAATIVVDVLEQCVTIGDLRHAIVAGALKASDVYAELGEIVAGKKPGRTNADQIFVFDSTGMALQDTAAAAIVYERAIEAGIGMRMTLRE